MTKHKDIEEIRERQVKILKEKSENSQKYSQKNSQKYKKTQANLRDTAKYRYLFKLRSKMKKR